ncbi:MAG: DUF1343 domain-containing protein, partial [Tannerellaceae bacterium]|nr:DUF1343 domain-containing protein [Tannerellaceae bacterium]
MKMRRIAILAGWAFVFLCAATASTAGQKPALILGAEQIDTIAGLVKGRQVGLVVNQTSIL